MSSSVKIVKRESTFGIMAKVYASSVIVVVEEPKFWSNQPQQ